MADHDKHHDAPLEADTTDGNGSPHPVPADPGYGYAPSQSRTTNIPPRMPPGYVPVPDAAVSDGDKASARGEKSAAMDAPMRTHLQDEEQRQRYRRTHAPRAGRSGRGRRRALWTVLIVLLLAAAGAACYFRLTQPPVQSAPPAMPTAADSQPPAPPAVGDTLSADSLRADSLQRADSLSRAKHEWYLHHKAMQEAEDAASAEASATATSATTATATGHSTATPAHSAAPHAPAAHTAAADSATRAQ